MRSDEDVPDWQFIHKPCVVARGARPALESMDSQLHVCVDCHHRQRHPWPGLWTSGWSRKGPPPRHIRAPVSSSSAEVAYSRLLQPRSCK